MKLIANIDESSILGEKSTLTEIPNNQARTIATSFQQYFLTEYAKYLREYDCSVEPPVKR